MNPWDKKFRGQYLTNPKKKPSVVQNRGPALGEQSLTFPVVGWRESGFRDPLDRFNQVDDEAFWRVRRAEFDRKRYRSPRKKS